jgi:CheY-like chemotaxis protein
VIVITTIGDNCHRSTTARCLTNGFRHPSCEWRREAIVQEERLNRVLIVDSDEHALTAIRRLLVQAGFEVTTAAEGEAALGRLQSSKFDLVFLAETFADLLSDKGLQRSKRDVGCQPPVIILQSGIATREGPVLRNSALADGFVNKWQACEVLQIAGEALHGVGSL